MATIDEELGQLERDIRQLKIEYDQFFGGGRSARRRKSSGVLSRSSNATASAAAT